MVSRNLHSYKKETTYDQPFLSCQTMSLYLHIFDTLEAARYTGALLFYTIHHQHTCVLNNHECLGVHIKRNRTWLHGWQSSSCINFASYSHYILCYTHYGTSLNTKLFSIAKKIIFLRLVLKSRTGCNTTAHANWTMKHSLLDWLNIKKWRAIIPP